MSGGSAGSLVVWRALVRQPGRTVSAGAMGFFAALFVATALVLFAAINPSPDQTTAEANLNADAVFSYGMAGAGQDEAAALNALTEALHSRYGADTVVSTSVWANGVTIATATQGGSAMSRTTTQYREYDTQVIDVASAKTLTTGTWPTSAGQVAVSQRLADDLSVAAGAEVHLAMTDRPVLVTGVYRPNLAYDLSEVVGESGTWQQNVGAIAPSSVEFVLNTASVLLPAHSRDVFVSDFGALRVGSPIGAVPGFQRAEDLGVDATSYAWGKPALRSFWVRNVTSFTIHAVILLIGLVTGQQLVRMRRDRAFVGALSALGFDRRALTGIGTTLSAVPLAVGAVVGAVGGSLLGLAIRRPVAALNNADVSTTPPNAAVIAGMSLVIAGLCAVLSALVAWRAAYRSDVILESTAFSEPARPHPWLVRSSAAGAAALAVASLLVGLVVPGGTERDLMLTGLLCAALVALVPAILSAACRVAPTRLVIWLGARLARAQPARVIGLTTVVAIGVAVPLGMSLLNASYVAATVAGDRPRVPVGQVAVVTPEGRAQLDSASVAALEQAAGSPAIETYEASNSSGTQRGFVTTSNDAPGSLGSPVAIVSDRAHAEATLDWSMSDADWAALEAGSALWLSTDPMPAGPASVVDIAGSSSTPTGKTLELVRPTETPSNPALAWGPVLITRSTAQAAGIPVRTSGYRFIDADSRYSAVVEAAAALEIPGGAVRHYTPPPALKTPVSFTTALVAVAVLVGAATFMLVMAGAREAATFDAAAHALGVDRRRIGRMHRLISLTVAGCGAVIGVLAAVGIALSNLGSMQGLVDLSLPWAQVALTLVLVLAISTGASMLASPAGAREPGLRTR